MEEILGESSEGTKPYNDISLPSNPSDKTTKWDFQDDGANRTMGNTETLNI